MDPASSAESGDCVCRAGRCRGPGLCSTVPARGSTETGQAGCPPCPGSSSCAWQRPQGTGGRWAESSRPATAVTRRTCMAVAARAQSPGHVPKACAHPSICTCRYQQPAIRWHWETARLGRFCLIMQLQPQLRGSAALNVTPALCAARTTAGGQLGPASSGRGFCRRRYFWLLGCKRVGRLQLPLRCCTGLSCHRQGLWAHFACTLLHDACPVKVHASAEQSLNTAMSTTAPEASTRRCEAVCACYCGATPIRVQSRVWQ